MQQKPDPPAPAGPIPETPSQDELEAAAGAAIEEAGSYEDAVVEVNINKGSGS